jgi:molybdopterin-guanine dinucleotide biosynthesis protein A
MINNISGVILAGGNSKRFNGIVKSKITIDGKMIISGIIETLAYIFDEITIVTNTPDEFREYHTCKIIGDKFRNKGPLGGIHSALEETDKEAVFVVAGDMPKLDKDIITRQIDFYYHNNCDILIPRINQHIEPLHGIYRKTLTGIMTEYLEGRNNYAIREFLKKPEVHVRLIEFEESEKNARAFTNINSPADIRKLKRLPGSDC